MADQNRVTPFSEIVAIPQRGLFMGNRGSIHRGRTIARAWRTKRWITCALEFKGWRAPTWEPGRWTALFFYDEAVALAAGHRPCALCRRADYERWMSAWRAAFGGRPSAEEMDAVLHDARVDARQQRRHPAAWSSLPTGTFVEREGVAWLALEDRLVPWSSDGYGSPIERPARGDATVLTPASTVAVLRGYLPVIHGEASRRARVR